MSFYVILVTINFLLRVVMFGLRFGYFWNTLYIYWGWWTSRKTCFSNRSVNGGSCRTTGAGWSSSDSRGVVQYHWHQCWLGSYNSLQETEDAEGLCSLGAKTTSTRPEGTKINCLSGASRSVSRWRRRLSSSDCDSGWVRVSFLRTREQAVVHAMETCGFTKVKKVLVEAFSKQGSLLIFLGLKRHNTPTRSWKGN